METTTATRTRTATETTATTRSPHSRTRHRARPVLRRGPGIFVPGDVGVTSPANEGMARA